MWGILLPELGNRDLRFPDPQLLAYSNSLVPDQVKRNNANAKLCLSCSVAYEILLLDHKDVVCERSLLDQSAVSRHRHACDVDGLTGTTKLVCHVFPLALSMSGMQLYATTGHGTRQRGRSASFQSA